MLFRYFDGHKYCFADPYRVFRQIKEHKKFDLDAMADAIDQGDHEATELAVSTICEVFGVKRFEGSNGAGLTDTEMVGLLSDLLGYLEEVKKKYDPGPMSPSPMESTL